MNICAYFYINRKINPEPKYYYDKNFQGEWTFSENIISDDGRNF